MPVARCNDESGIQYIGWSLRDAIGVAQDGDTVDLSGLGCSLITLTHGEIAVSQNALNLTGPGGHALTISGNDNGRVLHHYGTGTLSIGSLRFTHGLALGGGSGGCIASNGVVGITDSYISACNATNRGGGLYTKGTLTATRTVISGNGAPHGGGLFSIGNVSLLDTTVSGNINGGGVQTLGGVNASVCSIVDNHALTDSGGGLLAGAGVVLFGCTVSGNSANSAGANGGGISTQGYVVVSYSTISGNSALQGSGGGIFSVAKLAMSVSTMDTNTAGNYGGGSFTYLADISNSTISGNKATVSGGGMYFEEGTLKNSTLAFNSANGISSASVGGLHAGKAYLISSIVAKNRSAVNVADVYISTNGIFTAVNSLIVSSNRTSASLASDPQLTPLATHGGSVRTHALLQTSPALDTGSNPDSLHTDERGASRPVGAGTDIGAYERQTNDDELFFGAFD